jgi:putative endonuclease
MYVLKSYADKELYIGSTNDLKRRLLEHNTGLVKATKHRTPLEIIYYEAYKVEADARSREARLKDRGQARRQLLIRISKSLQDES